MAARADRIAAEQRWNRAKAVSGLGLADILQSPTIQALSQTRAQLAADYQDRLRVYKPDWPDMRQLEARLDETDRQIAAEASTIRSALHNTYAIALAREQALDSPGRRRESGRSGSARPVGALHHSSSGRGTNRALYERCGQIQGRGTSGGHGRQAPSRSSNAPNRRRGPQALHHGWS